MEFAPDVSAVPNQALVLSTGKSFPPAASLAVSPGSSRRFLKSNRGRHRVLPHVVVSSPAQTLALSPQVDSQTQEECLARPSPNT